MQLKLNYKDRQKRVPIRRRVMTIVLQTTLIALIAASVTGIMCIHWIKNASADALTRRLVTNLKSVVEQKAAAANAKLDHYEKYIELVADFIHRMYQDEAKMISVGRIYGPPLDTTEFEMTRGFINEEMSAEDFTDELLFYSNLEHIWDPIARENEDLITTVYAGTKTGLITSYDRWSYLSTRPDGGEFIYNFFEADWYKQGLEADGPFYTSLYVDSQGRGLTITVASPFRNAQGEVMGVECADYDITGLHRELLSLDLGEGSFSFALDKDDGIVSPDAESLTLEAYTGLSAQEIDALKADPDGIMEVRDAVYVCTPIERVDWTLFACVPKAVIQNSINETDRSIQYAFLIFVGVAIFIILLAVLAVNRAAYTITYPMELLGRDIKIISEGDLNYRASVYRNDEIGDITRGMNEMMDRLKQTMEKLLSTQHHADVMSRLATRDALTNLRNKTAYREEVHNLDVALAEGNQAFGIAMIDLNNLKVINDSYGHDKGDITIKALCKIVCDTFDHSPVFRVGGDEFVVVLRDTDYDNISTLVTQFRQAVDKTASDTALEPWDRVSAAIGYALYDPALDAGADDVMVRADHQMYRSKKRMKQDSQT